MLDKTSYLTVKATSVLSGRQILLCLELVTAVGDSNVAHLPCQTKFINYIKCILTGVVTAPFLFDQR